MNYNYIVANPTGNITVLVTDPVAPENRAWVVKDIFGKEPDCEQVGFVMPLGEDRISLEMMGGEFCGNAAISAAAYLVSLGTPIPELTQTVIVEASGSEEPVPVSVHCKAAGCFTGTLEMPMPERSSYTLRIHDSAENFPLVRLGGIAHLILPAAKVSSEEMETAIKEVANNLDVPACGMIKYLDSSDGVVIEPLVYVKGSDTLVWEQGCASGSVSAAYCKHETDGTESVDVRNPGGIINIRFSKGRTFMTGGILL